MPRLAFLLDVDNTLLNNDEVKKDFDAHLQAELGPKLTQQFWDLYEQVRHEQNVIDIPLTLTRLREETPLSELDELTYQHVHSIFDNYPFVRALYPDAVETLQHLGTLGETIIVSDGDPIFQAEKIVNSHLAEVVQGRVMLFIHKQEHLDEIMKQYPADHYALIDDKPQILFDAKKYMEDKLTTVFVLQGKYAHDTLPDGFKPDITVQHIGDLRSYNAEQFFPTKRV